MSIVFFGRKEGFFRLWASIFTFFLCVHICVYVCPNLYPYVFLRLSDSVYTCICVCVHIYFSRRGYPYLLLSEFIPISLYGGSSGDAVPKVMDYDVKLNEFKIQSRYCINFLAKTLRKSMKPLSFHLKPKEYHYCSSPRVALAFDNCYGDYLHDNSSFFMNTNPIYSRETTSRQNRAYVLLSGRHWAGTHSSRPRWSVHRSGRVCPGSRGTIYQPGSSGSRLRCAKTGILVPQEQSPGSNPPWRG